MSFGAKVGLSNNAFIQSRAVVLDPTLDNTYVNYTSNNANKNIKTTTPISLLNAVQAEITFYAKWDLEKGRDFVQLEISKDNI